MVEGSCLCGAVRWTLRDVPAEATACSCTACRRYGALWAYGFEGEDIHFHGPTTAYARGDSLTFNFCATCGNLSHWWGLTVNAEGKRRVAVNLRMTEPGPIAEVPIRHFDGLDTWSRQPGAGARVKDLWY